MRNSFKVTILIYSNMEIYQFDFLILHSYTIYTIYSSKPPHLQVYMSHVMSLTLLSTFEIKVGN